MAKEDVLTFEGRVVEVLPDARYRVELENGHQIVAYTAGRMKKNRIKTLIGDRVMVEMTPYDLEKGRLVYRHKGDSSGPPPAARGQRPPPRRR
jgi:translation initiation factor IF-1